jgi:two-component system nitrogen regulation sensor histidine kinase NtrY
MSVGIFTPDSFLQRWSDKLSRLTLSRSVAIGLAVAAVASCVATYLVLTRRSADINTVYWLLNLDLVLLLLLGTVISRQLVKIWSEKKRGVAGSRLHIRLVLAFSLMAAAPAILMAVFSSIFLYFGVQAWFNDRVSTAVNSSLAVAQAYLKEHREVMRADVMAMAYDLNRDVRYLDENPQAFSQLIQTQSSIRNLPEAVVFRSNGDILSRSRMALMLEMETLPKDLMKRADGGEVVLVTGGSSDRIRALVKLERFFDAYLYVGRLVDGSVLQHMETAERAVKEYTTLDGRKSRVQIAMTAMFAAISLLLLMAAVWFGLVFSEQLVAPISALIRAAEKVRGGDLSARVPDVSGAPSEQDDEIVLLGRAFNRMTSQLQSQQKELLAANRMLDERRRFTEAVLASASSGIIGLDRQGRITLANLRAGELLLGGANDDTLGLNGRRLADFIPEAEDVFLRASGDIDRPAQAQLDYAAGSGPRRTVLLRITAEQGGNGAVATLDDISALVSAQRNAAWADVARRIAHEIKNPLTPIQLSAERLRRKYLPQIKDDPETFAKCTDTIIRQVGDIGHMVSEFSAYARMPVSVKKTENVAEICHDALSLQQHAYPDIDFDFEADETELPANCDRSQLTQVLNNLLINAVDSVHERLQAVPAPSGRVSMQVGSKAGNIVISVRDNGIGLPEKVRDQLLEPYVTTKKKGSGLGLAIVKKIMEDHEGSIEISDYHDEGVKSGAKAVIVFPRDVLAGEAKP